MICFYVIHDLCLELVRLERIRLVKVKVSVKLVPWVIRVLVVLPYVLFVNLDGFAGTYIAVYIYCILI